MEGDAHPTDRLGLEILSKAECDRLLGEGTIGRIAFVSAGEPAIVPVNYRFHDGSIVLRTARGEKLDAAALEAPVAFEIDAWDPEEHTGWSVLVRGRAEEVDGPEEIAELDALGLRPWANAPEQRLWIRIRRLETTGRRVG